MRCDLIKYDGNKQATLDDLSGTLDDIGQLIGYLRDLSRDLVPLTNSLVPLSVNLNDLIEDFPNRLEKFFNANPFFAISGLLGILMVGGYLGTGIIKNILAISRGIK